jgi:cytoskeleton protein RodZ
LDVDSGSVGGRLKDARVARGLSLEDIAHTTKVPRSMLQHLEADAFQRMPAPVFVRGFIRAYAKAVGVDPNPIVRAFEQRTAGGPALAATGYTPAPGGGARREEVDDAEAARRSRARSGLDTDRKLVPLEPVSERHEGSFRRGYALLAVVAVGLLIAAWLMVGGQRPPSDASARGPSGDTSAFGGPVLGGPAVPDVGTPALHERIEGVPAPRSERAPGRDETPPTRGDGRSGR